MLKTLLILLFSVSISWAAPKSVEVWFLSIDSTTMLETPLKYSSKIAQRNLQCQQMGEYCFDPQVGLYKKGEETEKIEEVDFSKVEENKKYDFIDHHKGASRESIECDQKANMFDVFCGKAKKIANSVKAKLEIWVDISSTMKQVDFDGFDKACQRERFLRSVNDSCVNKNGSLKIYFFEEYLKAAGMLDRVCLSSGLNDMKRIIAALKRSKADHVLIITDIFEARDTFIDAVEALGVTKVKGVDKPFYSSMIQKEVTRIKKLCI